MDIFELVIVKLKEEVARLILIYLRMVISLNKILSLATCANLSVAHLLM